MENKNIYNIPVDLITSKTFKIEAKTQREAIDTLKAFLKSHEATNNIFDQFKIKETEIDSNQDEDIIDTVIKDFNLKTEEGYGVECVTHKIGVDSIHPDFNDVQQGFRTLHSFCGCDFVFIVDGKIHGIFQGVKFDTTKGLELSAELAIFAGMDEAYESLRNAKDVHMIQIAANEYNIKMMKDYHQVTFIGEEYNPTIDTVVDTTIFKFELSEAPSNFKTISNEEWEKLYSPIFNKS